MHLLCYDLFTRTDLVASVKLVIISVGSSHGNSNSNDNGIDNDDSKSRRGTDLAKALLELDVHVRPSERVPKPAKHVGTDMCSDR